MIRKYQLGGATLQDLQQLLIQMGMQIIQAALQGDNQAILIAEMALQVAQDRTKLDLVMQAALQGDENALLIVAVLMAMQLAQGAQSARQGAKLNYIKKLRGVCPEGYEISYFKVGGRVCKKCMKKALEGTRMQPVRKQNAVEEFKCGGRKKKSKKSCEK